MSFKSQRCTSTIYSGILRCEKQRGHGGTHSAYSKKDCMFLHWSDSYLEDKEIPALSGGPEKRTDPIVSWRWWLFGPRGMLKSITSGSEWLSPTMTTKLNPETGELARVTSKNPINSPNAKVLVRDNPSLDWGVFSYKTPQKMHEINPIWFSYDPMILGKLHNLGHVVEHEFGYRSQKVIVQELWVFHEDPKIRFNSGWKRATEQRYDCEVHFVPKVKLEGWLKYYSFPEETER